LVCVYSIKAHVDTCGCFDWGRMSGLLFTYIGTCRILTYDIIQMTYISNVFEIKNESVLNFESLILK
jgi:hypothetical protein